MIRRSSVVLGSVGVAVAVLGALVNPIVVPMVSKLPANTDMTVHYAGTASLVDQSAVARGDLAGAVKNGVPLTLDRRIHVISTSGDTALVGDDQTLKISGLPGVPDDHVYAIDRTTLQARSAPSGQSAEPASGIPIGWPLSPSSTDGYRYYDPTTQTSAALKYTGQGSVLGRSTLAFQSTVPSAPVKDKSVLATLPTTLPKNVLQALAASPTPVLPQAALAALTPAALSALPDAVPVAYTATTTVRADVDTVVGFPLAQHLQQQVILNVQLPGGQTVPLMPVLSTDLTLVPASQRYLVDKANKSAFQLEVIKTYIPWTLIGIGVLLLAVGVVRRKPKGPGAQREFAKAVVGAKD